MTKPTICAGPRRAPQDALAVLRRAGCSIRPDDEELTAWYERYRAEHHERLAIDLAMVQQQVPAPAAVLECGAVPLLMTAALHERGYQVRGVDLAPERFASAIEQLGLQVASCDIERDALPFDTASFDLVLFHELFEHLRIDPLFTFEEVRRVLRPGGTLMLSTPNLRSLRGLRNLVVHQRGHASSGGIYAQYEKLRRIGHMGHVREYTPREIVEFLAASGLRTERLVFRGGYGRGIVGLVERMLPSLQPFFSAIAVRV